MNSQDNFKLKLAIELPGQPPISPTVFEAIRKNLSKDGHLAKTIAERFPFGLIPEKRLERAKFFFRDENFKFLQDMMLTNERIHDLFKEWAQDAAMKRMLYNRRLTQDEEIERFYRRCDEVTLYKSVRIVREILKSMAKFQHRFDKHRVAADFELARFIREHQNERFGEQRLKKLYDHKIRVNPYDSRLLLPTDRAPSYESRNKDIVKSIAHYERLDRLGGIRDYFTKDHMDRLEQNLAQQKQVYDTGTPRFEKVLIDPRPGKAKWALRLDHGLELGKVEAGTQLGAGRSDDAKG